MSRMRKKRESLGMTQLAAAFKADVSINTIQSFEAGTLRPLMRTRKKLAEVYGITLVAVAQHCRDGVAARELAVTG